MSSWINRWRMGKSQDQRRQAAADGNIRRNLAVGSFEKFVCPVCGRETNRRVFNQKKGVFEFRHMVPVIGRFRERVYRAEYCESKSGGMIA